jgi:hypothetical protein
VPKMVQDSKPVGVSEFKKKTELKLGRPDGRRRWLEGVIMWSEE